MITAFGKELRKIRVSNGEILKDMAAKLNVSTAFLSAVEVGKKNVPSNWIEIIASEYGLSVDEKNNLLRLAQEAVNTIKLDLRSSGEVQRSAALVFARDFSKLNEDTAEKIIKMMQTSNKAGGK